MVVNITEIIDAKHSSANSRSKYIRVDCKTSTDEVVRFMVPFEILRTPDGPKVKVKLDETELERDDITQRIVGAEVPEEVKSKVKELRSGIGNW